MRTRQKKTGKKQKEKELEQVLARVLDQRFSFAFPSRARLEFLEAGTTRGKDELT